MADAAGNRQYDNVVKNFLSNKPVLARILKGCVEEFKPFDIDTIISEGNQFVMRAINETMDRDEEGEKVKE